MKPRWVTWHGVSAPYTPSELAFMRRLRSVSRREAWRVHVAKWVTGGRLRD